MLLTSSQISMGISSAIVFIFTSLLFLSGYILQQQTVRNLQAVINPPPAPSPTFTAPPPDELDTPLSFDERIGIAASGGLVQGLLSIGSKKPPNGGWRKVAYAQVVTEHTKLCNALMVFAALEKVRSKAGRVLLVPRAWVEVGGEEDSEDGLETTRRLLSTAVRKFDVVLRPIEQNHDVPIHSLLTLSGYNTLLHLPPSGILLSPPFLDAIFLAPDTSPVSALSPSFSSLDTPGDPSTTSSGNKILLIHPSPSLSSLQPDSDVISDLILTTSYLPDQSQLNLTRLLPSAHSSSSRKGYSRKGARPPRRSSSSVGDPKVAYIHIAPLSKQQIGPEYDIPPPVWATARPVEMDRKEAWGRIYERFREERRGVCGLDLEPWLGRRETRRSESERL